MSAINGKYKKMAPFLDQSQDTFTRMNIDPVERKKAIADMKKRTKAYQYGPVKISRLNQHIRQV